MSDTARSNPLIQAVRRQEAANVAARILAGEQDGDVSDARDVQNACRAISARMARERQDLIERFADSGISAEAMAGPEDDATLQFNLTGLRIAKQDLAVALKTAHEAGYQLPFEAGPNQVRALARYAPRLVLTRHDSAATRVVLHLSGQRAVPHVLRPKPTDIAVINLPKPLVGLYPAVRLFRVLGNRLTGRRAPHSDSDALGTPESLIDKLLDLIEPSRDDVLLDLGCGDGRIVSAAAERFGCGAIGIEANNTLVKLARNRIEARGTGVVSRTEIRHGYVETAEVSQASIVFLFLPAFVLSRLLPKILSSAQPGTRIVAHEQSSLRGVPEPQSTHLIVAEDAITVASVWRAT